MVDSAVRGQHKYSWVDGNENAETVTKILNPDKQFNQETKMALQKGDQIEVSP